MLDVKYCYQQSDYSIFARVYSHLFLDYRFCRIKKENSNVEIFEWQDEYVFQRNCSLPCKSTLNNITNFGQQIGPRIFQCLLSFDNARPSIS